MTTTTHPTVLSASTINGDAVENRSGENLGDIKDLVIDVDSGKIAYAVLDFGGFLGIGSKYFAVPWSALELCAEKKCFRLDATKEQLEQAEGFDKDNWPNMADRSWGASVHKQYNATPYWD